MRRIGIILAVILVILLGIGSLVFALLSPHPATQASVSAPNTPTLNSSATVVANLSPLLHVEGVIQSFSEQSFILALANSSSTMMVTMNNTTKYANFDGPITFDGLEVGQSVSVQGYTNPEDKTLLARRILVQPPMGMVSAVTDQSLSITTATGKKITLPLSNAPIIAVGNIAVSPQAVEVGFKIGYQGTTASDGSLTVTKIWLLLPHLVGTITAITGNSIQLQLTSTGAVRTFLIGQNTTLVSVPSAKATPAPMSLNALYTGSKVNVSVDGNGTSGTPLAVLIVVGTI